jgi:signal transduction histidine kinase
VETQLGAAVVGWVTRVTRVIAPWVLGVLVGAFALASPNGNPVQGMTAPYAEGGPDFVALSAVAVLCGVAAGVARRWRWPLFTLALLGWVFLTVVPTVVVASYYAAVYLTRRRALLFLTVAVPLVAVPPVIGHALYHSVDIGIAVGVFATGLLVGLPYAVGLWVNVRRQMLAALRERAERLEREQAAAAGQARAEERGRIAREMHDVVAHRVALMVLHAGALEVNAPDEQFAAEAALIRTTGREALGELRQVLGVLRGQEAATVAPPPDLSDVERLLSQARAAGLPVRLVRDGAPRELPLVVQRAAYRMIQEALTNVVKHTGGADTVVVLSYQPDAVRVTVENGPPVHGAEPMPGSGLGLIGLRERVALLGGRLESHPRLDSGYRLAATLPTGSPTALPTELPTGPAPRRLTEATPSAVDA